MADEHQTNAIIATALLDSFRAHPDHMRKDSKLPAVTFTELTRC
jgi:hypothetical protein